MGTLDIGKTEVAIRAAFKACMDSKQVAYLVPTTILANQQYISFKERMKDYPLRIELLNRFKTKKEQKEILKKLELGEIDIIVGTHRILSKDVKFKNLGLLIVDEEHRFGVEHKESLKKLKTNVDVLTMTATPIPRTLNMSIVGIRDMSCLYEPPESRMPVQTYVIEYDEEIIKEAIMKELERDGQIFYLYNKVEGIIKKAEEIQKLVPECKVRFAHGQMSGNELEEIMQDFIDKKFDVLVCTTILESGIDIPNANTIIVENADRLGLAQLYQIRGRVGRSDKQAYSYITYRRNKMLSEVAEKRLKAIKEFTEFGSGFKIAMRDLQIRGAGSFLGEAQHGHMEAVGYEMYTKLLDNAVKELEGKEIKENFDLQMDLKVSSYIPPTYIEDNSLKIEVYQDIAIAKTEEVLNDIMDELIDRFGDMPEDVYNLIECAKIKLIAKELWITSIIDKKGKIVFTFKNNNIKIDINKLISKYENNIMFSASICPYITYKIEEDNNRKYLQKIKQLLIDMKEN